MSGRCDETSTKGCALSPDSHHGGGAVGLRQHLDDADELAATVLGHQLFLAARQLHHRAQATVQHDVEVERRLVLPVTSTANITTARCRAMTHDGVPITTIFHKIPSAKHRAYAFRLHTSAWVCNVRVH